MTTIAMDASLHESRSRVATTARAPITLEALERDFHAQDRDFLYRSVLSHLQRRWPERLPKAILDVGSGAGRFLAVARLAGWHVEGLEPNPLAAAFAARHAKVTVHPVRAQELTADARRHGAVTLLNVLDQVADPDPVLAAARRHLHPGGLILIQTARDLGARPGAEAARVTPEDLRRALSRAGFAQVAVEVGAPDRVADEASDRWRIGAYRLARRLPAGLVAPWAASLRAIAVNPGDPA